MFVRSLSLANKFNTHNSVERRNRQRSYDIHIRKLHNIQSSLGLIYPKKPEYIKTRQSIDKYKHASKSIILQAREETRKKQNLLILNKLKGIHQRKSNLSPLNNHVKKNTINFRALEQKRKNQKILEQNLILIERVKSRSRSAKQMRQNIKQNVEEYLSKRARLRQIVLPMQQKKNREQLLCSSRGERSSRSLNCVRRCSSNSSKHLKSVEFGC